MEIYVSLRNCFSGIEEDELVPAAFDCLKAFLQFLTSEINLGVDKFLLFHEVFRVLQTEIIESHGKTFDILIKMLSELALESPLIQKMVNRIFSLLFSCKKENDSVYQNYFLFLQRASRVEILDFPASLKDKMLGVIKDASNEKNAVFCMKILGFFNRLTLQDLEHLAEFERGLKDGTELYHKCLREFLCSQVPVCQSLDRVRSFPPEEKLSKLEELVRTCRMPDKKIWYLEFLDLVAGFGATDKASNAKIKRILNLFEDCLDYEDPLIRERRKKLLQIKLSEFSENKGISNWVLEFIADFIEKSEDANSEIIEFFFALSKSKSLLCGKKGFKIFACLSTNILYKTYSPDIISFLESSDADLSISLSIRVIFLLFLLQIQK